MPTVEEALGAQRQLYQGLGASFMTPTYSYTRVNALAQFKLGLQLLHVFWFDLARQSFQQVSRLAD